MDSKSFIKKLLHKNIHFTSRKKLTTIIPPYLYSPTRKKGQTKIIYPFFSDFQLFLVTITSSQTSFDPKKGEDIFFVFFIKNQMALEKFRWSNFGNLIKIEPTVNILKILQKAKSWPKWLKIAIWSAIVALRSESGHNFFFNLTQLNILKYK